MKKEILFVILNEYADWESAYLAAAICAMGENKFVVKTVSHKAEPVQAIGGFKTIPDYIIATIPEKFEALFLIGGDSWKEEYAKDILPLIVDTKKKGKVLGGICGASEFLAANGLLNDVLHTSNGIESIESWEDNLYSNQEGYLEKQAVRDANIVTANGTAALEFARESLKALAITNDADIDSWYNFYRSGYYKE